MECETVRMTYDNRQRYVVDCDVHREDDLLIATVLKHVRDVREGSRLQLDV